MLWLLVYGKGINDEQIQTKLNAWVLPWYRARVEIRTTVMVVCVTTHIKNMIMIITIDTDTIIINIMIIITLPSQ